MQRFFFYPLLICLLIGLELMAYLCSVLLTWSWLFMVLLQPLGFRPRTTWATMWSSLLYEFEWSISRLIEPKWPYLLGLGVLLGLGLASYEMARSKFHPGQRSRGGLVLNVFWFGLYLLLLTTPIACILEALSLRYPAYQLLFPTVFHAFLPWSGLLVVSLAGIYFITSGQVLSPKAIARRIRYGRFQDSHI